MVEGTSSAKAGKGHRKDGIGGPKCGTDEIKRVVGKRG